MTLGLACRRRLGLVGWLVAVSLGAVTKSSVGSDSPPPRWVKVAEGTTGERLSSALLHAPDSDTLLLCGPADGAPWVQAYDPTARAWSTVTDVAPPLERLHPYYQTAYDPRTRTVYCLTGTPVLYALSLAEGTWRALPAAPELDGLGWHAMACDPRQGKLVVIGADKRAGSIGWTRTVVYDIAAGTWSRLGVEDPEAEQARSELEALGEAVADLVGRTRLAWYRDPNGTGSDPEIRELAARAGELARHSRASAHLERIEAIRKLLLEKRTLDALHVARALSRDIEDAAESAYGAPRSRRNSPLAFDEKSRVFVLFGGDHEDYLLNDTWILDLERGAWRRGSPDVAPSPRAGHALFPLPRAGGIALYEGYVQSRSTDYGAAPYRLLDPTQLWRYDPLSDRWSLLGAWPHPKKDEPSRIPPTGHFHGYASQWYSPPCIAADSADRIVLAASPGRVWFLPWKEFPVATWMLEGASLQPDAAGRGEHGSPPNVRLYRDGPFVAQFCEVEDAPAPTRVDDLPMNQWTRLPPAPRNPCQGCRQRDWGTSVWDSDRDQVLLWGGGHCVRSASTVAHWSPTSGRIVEGHDADEPYSANGGGGFDSSVLNRPWVSGHNYNHYAYDPKCRLLVSGRGYLYDPERMDWLRIEPYELPFVFEWPNTVVEGSPHGSVAWARTKDGDGRGTDDFGLWIFDRRTGWTDLEPQGPAPIFPPYCDAHGMVYDSKRDRMVIGGVGAKYQQRGDGSFLAFDFATRSIRPLVPENRELSRARNSRELAYVAHADWIVIGELLRDGDGEGSKPYTRIYDCARNRMLLLDAGDVPDGHSTGWMYDERRKLVYVFTYRGEAWALRIDPESARLLEEPARS